MVKDEGSDTQGDAKKVEIKDESDHDGSHHDEASESDSDSAELTESDSDKDKTHDEANDQDRDQEQSSDSHDDQGLESSEKVDDLMPPPDDSSTAESEAEADSVTNESAVEAAEDEGLAPVAQPPEYGSESQSNMEPMAAAVAGSGMQEAMQNDAYGVSEQHGSIPGSHPHRNNKKFAVLMVAIIGALLAGIAVYVYMSTSKNTEEVNKTTPTQSTANNSNDQAKATPATTKDVDSATQQVDQTVQSLNDTSDLNEDKISDQTLGIQ